MKKQSLAPHPRLFVTRQATESLKQEPAEPFGKACRTAVLAQAQRFARMPELQYPRNIHNEHLIRAREVQGRIVTLLTAWEMTGKARYRSAAVDYVRMMGAWDGWSWITWRNGDTHPESIFDLSYGENSATLAIAFDWLHATLSPEEKKLFVSIAKRWSFAAGRKHGRPGRAWWYGSSSSNWNTVCAGGLGMLALAMYEEVPAAKKLLPLMEASIKPFFDHLKVSDGAWPEGIGYWNYGMYYGFMYLLSCESATGKKHPAFRIPQFKKTLAFPIEFCPNGVGCSFGDVNHWAPMPLHLAVARRVGVKGTVSALRRLAAKNPPSAKTMGPGWPTAAYWCLFFGDEPVKQSGKRAPVTKLYRGQDWGVLSDDLLAPTRAMTVRGGTTKVPHGHLDLLSFHCVVGSESMITNLAPAEYLDTTFSPRRWDLFEMRPDAKNTIFVNGVGILPDSSCTRTEFLRTKGASAIRMDVSEAFGTMRDGKVADFAGRVILFVRDTYWIVVDRVAAKQLARLESRMHSLAQVKTGKGRAALKRGKESLRITCASTQPSTLVMAAGAPTTTRIEAATMLRWMTDKIHAETVHAAVLNPGTESRGVEVVQEGKTIVVEVTGKDGRDRFVLTPALKFKK
ncbi:MAG: heparinase II/III domain-containing protein [Planctomycetota bacterium]